MWLFFIQEGIARDYLTNLKKVDFTFYSSLSSWLVCSGNEATDGLIFQEGQFTCPTSMDYTRICCATWDA
jgi:hypothetical protein